MSLLNPFSEKKKEPDQQQEVQTQEHFQNRDLAMAGAVEDQHLIQEKIDKSDLTRWQQDLEGDVELVEHDLRRESFNEKRKKWQPTKVFDPITGKTKDAPPLCNEEGIKSIVGLLRGSTSKNLMMSKLTEDRIMTILHKLSDTLTVDVLLANRHRFNIRQCDMTPIVNIFQSFADATYFRALGGNEKEYLKGIRKDTYLHTDGAPLGQKQKGGFLGLFRGN